MWFASSWPASVSFFAQVGFASNQFPTMNAVIGVRRAARASKSWVAQCLEGGKGPVIAASDYVSALPDLIREWVPGRYVTLGTDGFGRSDTRRNLRAYFGVDRDSIVRAALGALGD